MSENKVNRKSGKVKVFLRGLVEKLDRKMVEKAMAKPCCSNSSGKEKNSCCS